MLLSLDDRKNGDYSSEEAEFLRDLRSLIACAIEKADTVTMSNHKSEPVTSLTVSITPLTPSPKVFISTYCNDMTETKASLK